MLNISPAPVSSAGLVSGTITRVQSTSANTGNASAASFNITFGASLTVGNLVVIAMHGGVSSATFKILDPGGSAVAYQATGFNTGGTPQQAALMFFVVTTAGTTLVASAHSGASLNSGVVAVEYSGAKFRVESNPIGNSGSSVTSSTASLVTGGSNELLIAVFGKRGTNATEQTGWLTSVTNNFSSVLQTSSFTNVAGTDAMVAFCERIVSAAGSYSTAGTQANAAWANCIGGFISD